jgi:FkbH-like protein
MAAQQAARVRPPTGESVRRELEHCTRLSDVLAGVDKLLAELGAAFTVEAAEAISAIIDERQAAATQTDRELLEQWTAALRRQYANSPTAHWVAARLLALLSQHEAAASAWQVALQLLPASEPEAWLYRSRALVRLQRCVLAADDLRSALRHSRDYGFWTRAEKVFGRLRKNFTPPSRRQLKLAVLSGKATVTAYAPLLRLAAFRDDIDAEILVGNYDNYAQEIIDPASPLYEFQPDVVILPTHWRDAALPALAEQGSDVAEAAAGRMLSLWEQLLEQHRATIIAHTFDLPAHESYGRLASSLPDGRVAMLRRVNDTLRAGAPAEVVLVDLEQLAAEVSAEGWSDAKQWYLSKQHPATGGLLPLIESHVAVLRAVTGLSKKVLALDLDNTCWGGIIGEDGLENIRLGPGSPAGEAFQDLQRYALELRQRGVLLAVCSKNNEADARLPFERHPDTVLKLSDFACFVANWDDKARNLRQIAQTLSLGLDSFVFVDDNPVERAWIRSQLPDVAVPELPDDPARFVPALAAHRYFESITLNEEDRARTASYQANVGREQLRGASTDIDQFLSELSMVATHGPFDAAKLPRIAQLVNKTNQFNLTTRRYSEAQLKAQADDPRWWTRWFRLKDRFGDHGLVGVIACKPREDEDGAMEVDNWLMSCRVLGRTLEHLMLATALEHCHSAGIAKLYGRFIPTAKNAQVRGLFPRFGATTIAADDKGTAFVLDVNSVKRPTCLITVADERETAVAP